MNYLSPRSCGCCAGSGDLDLVGRVVVRDRHNARFRRRQLAEAARHEAGGEPRLAEYVRRHMVPPTLSEVFAGDPTPTMKALGVMLRAFAIMASGRRRAVSLAG